MLVAYHRGRLPGDHGIGGGLMAATGLSAEQARLRVQGTNVVLACDNSPTSTTISGEDTLLRAPVAQDLVLFNLRSPSHGHSSAARNRSKMKIWSIGEAPML